MAASTIRQIVHGMEEIAHFIIDSTGIKDVKFLSLVF